jgi:hypothetical protein
MAKIQKYVSRYSDFRFVLRDGLVAQFRGGTFETDNPELIAALDKCGGAVNVEEGMRILPARLGPEITSQNTTASHIEQPRKRGRPRKVPLPTPETISTKEEFQGH